MHVPYAVIERGKEIATDNSYGILCRFLRGDEALVGVYHRDVFGFITVTLPTQGEFNHWEEGVRLGAHQRVGFYAVPLVLLSVPARQNWDNLFNPP